MPTTSDTSFVKHEIFVHEITFHGKLEISLYGFLHDGGKFHETEYLIERKDLQMLLNSNHCGLEILRKIEDLFLQPHQAPASINLIELFGTTQVFEAQNIELDIPFYEDESGDLMPLENHNLLFIEKVIPLTNNES